MNIQINNCDSQGGLLFKKPGGRNSHVVEYAKSRALVAEGVMGAPGEGAGKPSHKGCSGGGESAADAGECSMTRAGDQGNPMRRISQGRKYRQGRP